MVFERTIGVSTHSACAFNSVVDMIPSHSAHTSLLSDWGDMGAHGRQELLCKALDCGFTSGAQGRIVHGARSQFVPWNQESQEPSVFR